MVRIDNLSAGIDASSGFFGRMYRLYGDLSSVAKLQSGVAESIGIGWRLPSESGGGINRNQVADCVGICIIAGRLTLGDPRRPPRAIADLSMRFGKYFTKIDFHPGNPIEIEQVFAREYDF
jgi:hypothetical protein